MPRPSGYDPALEGRTLDTAIAGSTLTFVVPCWNEEEGLGAAIEAIRSAGDRAVEAGRIAGWTAVMVDDGSTDATPKILDAASDDDPRIRVVTHEHNRGLGAAIRSGLAAASGDLILYTDADMPCDLDVDVTRALVLLETYGADVVAAYRRARRGEGPRRLVYSAVYNALVRRTFRLRLRDVNFAFKLFRAASVDTTALQSEGSFVDVELLARAHAQGLKIVQFGTQYFPRTRGISTLSSVATIATIAREMRDIGRTIPRRPRRGEDAGERILIVNADDYGLTEGVSEGILRAIDAGVVTSTSVLALGSGFAASAGALASAGVRGVGVHLAAVGEDPPLLSPREIPTLVDGRGRLRSSWRVLLPLLAAGRVDPADLRREFMAQIEAVRATGVTISHLDTHQHLHLWPLVRDVVVDLAQETGIRAIRVPRSAANGLQGAGIRRLADALARRATECGLVHPAWAVGLDEAGHMHGNRLERALEILTAKSGHVELSAHPGDPRDVDRYRWNYDWADEMAALSSPRIHARIADAGLVLGSYHDLVPAKV